MWSRTAQQRGLLYRDGRCRGPGVKRRAGSPIPAWKDRPRRGIWKTTADKMVAAKGITGISDMRFMASEINAAKMDMSRTGGFAPSQWALGRFPRRGGGDQGDEETAVQVGAQQSRVDGVTEFARRSEYHEPARKAFVYADCSTMLSRLC